MWRMGEYILVDKRLDADTTHLRGDFVHNAKHDRAILDGAGRSFMLQRLAILY